MLQVVIESVRGSSYQGDISIDDLSMTQFCRSYSGPIPTPPPPHPSISLLLALALSFEAFGF